MTRPMIAMEGFQESVTSLGDTPATKNPLAALLLRLAKDPERWPAVPGSAARVITSQPRPDEPPLRLVYRVESDAIYLYEARLGE